MSWWNIPQSGACAGGRGWREGGREGGTYQDGVAICPHTGLEGGLDGVGNVILGLKRLVERHTGEGGADDVVDVGADLLLRGRGG